MKNFLNTLALLFLLTSTLIGCGTVNPPQVRPYLNHVYTFPHDMVILEMNDNASTLHLFSTSELQGKRVFSFRIPKGTKFLFKEYRSRNFGGNDFISVVIQDGKYAGRSALLWDNKTLIQSLNLKMIPVKITTRSYQGLFGKPKDVTYDVEISPFESPGVGSGKPASLN